MQKPYPGIERLAMTCIALGFVTATLAHAQGMERLTGSATEARSRMAAFQQARLENAEPNLLLAPFYSVSEGHSTQLILLNKFSEEVDFELRVQGPGGSSFPLTWITLTPREITVLDLEKDFGSLPKAFQEGSLTLEYFGDPEMAQGWVVISSTTNDTEFPLINPGKAESQACTQYLPLMSTT